MSEKSPQIAVVGSLNMDLIIESPRLPRPGETVIASDSQQSPGGKGGNQSVAAARLGATVSHIGRLGDDSFGDLLADNLKAEKIDIQAVQRTEQTPSGLAVVMVDLQGHNSIMVVPGANSLLTPDDIEKHAEVIRNADLLLVQLEVPIEAVLKAIEIAKEASTRLILDPAPVPAANLLTPELLGVDLACPNATEAEEILGVSINSVQDARQAAWKFTQLGTKNVIITLGEEGAVLSDGKGIDFVAPYAVDVEDTTAAGDAFAAAVAVRWAEGVELAEAARFACAAGALTSTKLGAQEAMPTRQEVESLVESSE